MTDDIFLTVLAAWRMMCLPQRQSSCARMRRWSDPGKASRPYRRQQAHGGSLFQDMLSQLAVAEAPSVQPAVYARAPSLVARLRAASHAVPPALAAHLRSLSRAALPRSRQPLGSTQGLQVCSGSRSLSDMGGSLGSGSTSSLKMMPLVPAHPAGVSLQAQLQAQAQARVERLAQGLVAESGTAQIADGPRVQDQRKTAGAGAHGRTANDSQNLGSGDGNFRTGVDVLKVGRAGLRRLSPQPRDAAPDQLQAELLREFRSRKAGVELQAEAQRQAGLAAAALATLPALPAVRKPRSNDIASQGASSPSGHALHAPVPSLQERIQAEVRARAGPAGHLSMKHPGMRPAAQSEPAALSLQDQLQANFQARAERAGRVGLKAEGITAGNATAASASSGSKTASASGHGGAALSLQDQLQASLRQRTERAKQERAAATLPQGGSTTAGSSLRDAVSSAHRPGRGLLETQHELPSRQGFTAGQQVTKVQHVAIGRPAKRT